MMTMFRNQFREISTTAFAFSLISVVGIFPIHKILEIGSPSLAASVDG